jgi:tight adherence protein C
MELAFMLVAGVSAFFFVIGLAGIWSALADPARRRLEQLKETPAPTVAAAERVLKRLGALSRFTLPAGGPDLPRVEKLLRCAGLRSHHAVSAFYGAKALLMALLPAVVLLSSPLYPIVRSGILLFYAVAGGALGWLLPSIWLDRRVQSRQRALRIGLPDALDLLVVCVESGLGLAPAIQRVADEISVSHPELAAELALVTAETRAGVDRAESLAHLAERTGLTDIRGLVALMTQTMRFGTSVTEALRVYADEFRDRRMQAAEELAAKIGTKIIFPLILCLFPSFFLVAISPAVIRLSGVFAQLHH